MRRRAIKWITVASALAAAIAVVGAFLALRATPRPAAIALASSSCSASGPSFCISSPSVGPVLYPGAPAKNLPLTFSNPTSAPIYVTSLAVTFMNAFPANCPSSAFQVNGIGASGTTPMVTVNFPTASSWILVPAASGSTPGTATYPATLSLADTHTNQDTCENLGLSMSYTASASYTVPTTTALVDSPNPSTTGQSVTLTATVAPSITPSSAGSTPVGQASFYQCTNPTCSTTTTLGSSALNSSGVATLNYVFPSSGSAMVYATFTPTDSTNFSTSTSSKVTQAVGAGTATDVLTSSKNPTTVGTAVTYTATVAGGGLKPTGSVTFKDGGTPITGCGSSGVVSLSSSGVATCTVTYTTKSGSPHSITAPYSGDTNYNTAAGNTVSETVNQGNASDSVTSSLNPATVGSSVTYTATVAGGGATPTGSVTFKDGGTAITSCGSGGVVNLGSSGVATCTVTYKTTSGSPHSITAPYSGDTNYNTAAGNTLSETINKENAKDTLTSSLNPGTVGVVTYTATVMGDGVTPTGSVTFMDGGSAITSCGSSGVVSLNSSGVATCTVSYKTTSGSPHSITAPYSGDANYNGVPGNTLSETINKGTPADTVGSSLNPTGAGTPVTYTATITGAGATPTGSVTFKDGGTPIASCGSSGVVNLSSGGIATCTVNYGVAGTHSITAPYSGDSNYFTAAGNVVSETVNYTSCITGKSNANLTVASGQDICISSTGSQNGNVTVSSGGRLDVLGGTVNGTITVNSGGALNVNGGSITGNTVSTGASLFTVCQGKFTGNVSASSSNAFVLIGGDDSYGTGCSGNTITGRITLTGNKAGVEVALDTVSDSVTLTGNTTSGSENAVEANTIGKGGLACSSNVPPPTNAGHPNKVSGPRSGQCSAAGL